MQTSPHRPTRPPHRPPPGPRPAPPKLPKLPKKAIFRTSGGIGVGIGKPVNDKGAS